MICVKISLVRVIRSAWPLISFYPNFSYLLNVLGEIRHTKSSCRLLDRCVSQKLDQRSLSLIKGVNKFCSYFVQFRPIWIKFGIANRHKT